MKILDYIEKSAGIRGINLKPTTPSLMDSLLERLNRISPVELRTSNPSMTLGDIERLKREMVPNTLMDRAPMDVRRGLNASFKRGQEAARAAGPEGLSPDVSRAIRESAWSRLNAGSYRDPEEARALDRALNRIATFDSVLGE